MSAPTDAQRKLAIAQAEVEQACVERDRLGINIGSEPRPELQHAYLAALRKLRAVENEVNDHGDA